MTSILVLLCTFYSSQPLEASARAKENIELIAPGKGLGRGRPQSLDNPGGPKLVNISNGKDEVYYCAGNGFVFLYSSEEFYRLRNGELKASTRDPSTAGQWLKGKLRQLSAPFELTEIEESLQFSAGSKSAIGVIVKARLNRHGYPVIWPLGFLSASASDNPARFLWLTGQLLINDPQKPKRVRTPVLARADLDRILDVELKRPALKASAELYHLGWVVPNKYFENREWQVREVHDAKLAYIFLVDDDSYFVSAETGTLIGGCPRFK